MWINELSKTRKVIAVEMQGHGRTADINRDITYENLADDVAGLLDYLKIERADIIGYSLGGGVAMQCAIRHPEKVRKVVSISAPIRRDGWVKEANDFWPTSRAEMFKGTPVEAEYKKLSPTPDKFPDFFNHIKATALKPYDFGADKLKATKAPMFFIHGDADGVRLDHIAEMYRLKGGRSTRRHAAAPGIETGHFARHNTRHADEPHDNDRPDDQRLSRCEAVKAIGWQFRRETRNTFPRRFRTMEFNPSNNVIKLCVQGMAMEDKGNAEEASRLFLQAWNEATNDFEKFIAAYYVARHQENVRDKLKWLETSLQFALKVNDVTVSSAFPCSVFEHCRML